MAFERVVITGMGSVTPLGRDAPTTFQGLADGRSGVRRMRWPTQHALQVQLGAPVVELDPGSGAERQGVLPRARFARFALASAREALTASGLRGAGYAPERVAVVFGVAMGAFGGVATLYEEEQTGAASWAHPAQMAELSPSLASRWIADEVGARGPNRTLSSACASSAHAIGEAFELVRCGRVDAVVTGGADALLAPVVIASFDRIGALSRWAGAPEQAARPFEASRDGFVMGEGAAALVLEARSRALQRGASILAELIGYGASADAHHVTHPADDGSGMARAIGAALTSARLAPEQVQYVNAHGTGTQLNDVAETAALKRVFGAHAHRLWISSNKSMFGHLMGAAAAAETVATVYTLMRQLAPPTLNLEQADGRCDLDYVPHTARQGALRVAINNAFGFGGQNACLVLARSE